MRWASTVSRAESLERAIAEASVELRRQLDDAAPDLAVVFVSQEHAAGFAALPALLGREISPTVLIGCSAGGVIGGGHEVEDAPGLSLTAAVLPGVTITPFHLPDAVAPDALPAALGVPIGGDHAFVVLPEPFSFDADAFLRTLDETYPGAVKLGGIASGGREPGRNALYLNDAVHRSGMVGVALSGDIAVDTIVAQGCRPIGEPMFVTRCERNVIHALDGRPPMSVLRELYERATPDDQALFRQSLFLGVAMVESRQEYRQGDFLIRNVLGIDSANGALVIGALPYDGLVVQFHLRDARTSADDLQALLQRYDGTPSGALLFSCLGRGKFLYGRADHDTAALRARCGELPVGGFFCNGEIGPVQGTTFLHGYTSSFGLFRPRDRT